MNPGVRVLQGAHARERLLSAIDFAHVGLGDLARARGTEAHALLERLLGGSHPLTAQAARFVAGLSPEEQGRASVRQRAFCWL